MVAIRQPDTNINGTSSRIISEYYQILFALSSNQIRRNRIKDLALDMGGSCHCNDADNNCNHTDCLSEMDQTQACIER